MTLTELRYLVTLAREHHFGRAAEKCFVSQPTLSVAIRKLEEELGVPLFERSASEVRPTPVGLQIVAQAQRVLDEAAAIKELARQGKDPLAGTLRLGVIFTVGPYLLPQLIPKLHRIAPQMPLIIQENYTARLAELLKQGELDVVIVAQPFNEPGVAVRPLYDEPFVVAIPKGHPWESRKSIRGEDLGGEDMLMLGAGHCFRDQVLQVFPALNRASEATGSMSRVLEGSSLETLRMMVASGAGVTVMPSTAAAAHGGRSALVRYLPFSRPVPDRRIVLAWRNSFTRTAAVEALREAVLACNLPGVEPVQGGRGE
ncbi:MAG: LysR substrate-binding domain-containing protein [Gammaproteobacteria bacterium]